MPGGRASQFGDPIAARRASRRAPHRRPALATASVTGQVINPRQAVARLQFPGLFLAYATMRTQQWVLGGLHALDSGFPGSALEEGSIVELPPETARTWRKCCARAAATNWCCSTATAGNSAGSVSSVRGARVAVAVGAPPRRRESPLAMTLLQSVPRGDRMDFSCRRRPNWASRASCPSLSQRSVVRLDEARPSRRRPTGGRWRSAPANNAAATACRDRRAPQARPTISARAARGDLRLVLEPGPRTRGRDLDGGPTALEIGIGPEGGFTAG